MIKSGYIFIAMACTLALSGMASANGLDVPVLQYAGDGQHEDFTSEMVVGLPAGLDGFLAVRSGPGVAYRKLDELHNGDMVLVSERRGAWVGVIYRYSDVPGATPVTRPVQAKNVGWVSSKYLKLIAG